MSDIHSLGIQGSIITPSSEDYEKAISRPSGASVLRAAYVVFPTTPADIPLAIKFALSQTPPLQISVKGGGCHTSTASSSEGLVIDLSKLNKVTLAADKQSVTVEGGATWGNVYSALEKDNLVVVGGNVWFVGVGGYTTGGGYSSLSGQRGLAIDNLLGATIVLADGKIIQTNKDNEPDLFWAIRGGTNQFGVVIEFVFKAYPNNPALVGALAYPGTELANVLKVTHDFIKNQTPKSHLIINFARAPPHFYPGIMILPYIENDTGEAEKLLAPFRTEIKPVFEGVGIAPTFNAVSHGADSFMANAPPRTVTGGAMFTELWDDVLGKVFGDWVAFTENEEHRGTMVMWEFDSQAKIASIPQGDTAFPVRKPHYYAVITAGHSRPESDAPAREWVAKVASYIRNENTKRTGTKLPSPTNFSLGPEFDSAEEVFGESLPRLRKIKAKYDPKKVWSKGWVIEPDFS